MTIGYEERGRWIVRFEPAERLVGPPIQPTLGVIHKLRSFGFDVGLEVLANRVLDKRCEAVEMLKRSSALLCPEALFGREMVK